MKKISIIGLFIAIVLSIAKSYADTSSRPYTKTIPTIEMTAEVLKIEDFRHAVIATPKTDTITNLILKHEISGKHHGTKMIEGSMHYILRIGVYGLSKETNVDTLRKIMIGNRYPSRCHSVLLEDRANTVPICQFIAKDNDIFLEMVKVTQLQEDILLSTKLINPDLPLHTDYEKIIANLIINGF